MMQSAAASSSENTPPSPQLALSVILSVAFAVVFWVAHHFYSIDREIRTKGSAIEVSLEGRKRVQRTRGRSRHYLSVRFQPPGQPLRVLKKGVSRSFFEKVASEERLTALYMPKYPESIIFPEDDHRRRRVVRVFGGTMVLTAGLILFVVIRLAWIYHRLGKAHLAPTPEVGRGRGTA